MSGVVLDSSAVLALIWAEAGEPAVAAVMPEARISAVNVIEVVQKLVDRDVDDHVIRATLDGLELRVEPFDADQALQAGLLRRATRSKGLSLGDRACLALARSLGLPVITADRAWAELDLGVEVVLIR